MPLPITGKSPPFSFKFYDGWLLRACCVLYITPPPPPPPLFPRSPAIRNKEKARHLVFFLFVSLAQTTPAQPAGGTSPSVGLLVLLNYTTSRHHGGASPSSPCRG